MNLYLLPLSSPLHDKTLLNKALLPFFLAMQTDMELTCLSLEDRDDTPLPSPCAFFIATGGSENLFLRCHGLCKAPYILISYPLHNSLAAAMEIIARLQQRRQSFLHFHLPLAFDPEYYRNMAADMEKFIQAPPRPSTGSSICQTGSFVCPPRPENDPSHIKAGVRGMNIGLIGGVSDWLIASEVDTQAVSRQYECRFLPIATEEVLTRFKQEQIPGANGEPALSEALYRALRKICEKYRLHALTVKCFDLIGPCHTTACLALARLNDCGVPAGCEGDIPALFSMLLVRAFANRPAFMANPAEADEHGDPETGFRPYVVFAHCTAPLSMGVSHRYMTHFESGKGVGIKAVFPTGRYTLFKCYGPLLDRFLICSGRIAENMNEAARCRTQVKFVFDRVEDYRHYLNSGCGNHVILFADHARTPA